MSDIAPEVATVSLAKPLRDLADELGRSFEDYGFAVVENHGIDQGLIDRAEQMMRQFFALPDDVKRQYHRTGQAGARGYTPFGVEQAKGAAVQDLKEFWHVGRDLPAGHRYGAQMRPNVWPDEPSDFRPVMQDLFLAFDWTGRRILSAIALYLGEEEDFFEDAVRDGNSVLRLLHYPPVKGGPAGAIRAAAHEDINAITLLLGAEEAGLELLARDGRWLPVSPPPGALAVNIGDMLQRYTAGRLRSTTHRVVNPAGEAVGRARYSMPYFLHFRPDFLIDPLFEGGEEPITAQDYLMERLREIRLA
ncbi:isopenicillin N synthase family oxygenase [Altererythrobacter sp. KTW20L]|uniref:isopenicillin N synthase family dioxygenase n=1 Tax=Altererythrobacter sp. KTW20L TaxID=2942210 RepID=UPI0020C010F0|nr:2-oxoglutarate and iron-dependent oxygenase domain-containing protein [Altererythrobacter sp. KTW20L]MCL6250740.1 isopenicillin N synthase family oxygenase [Altererythrobacter sp. KTW20L]